MYMYVHVDIDGAPVLGQLTLETTETGEIYVYSKKIREINKINR